VLVGKDQYNRLATETWAGWERVINKVHITEYTTQ